MTFPKGSIAYEADKNAIARKLGYKNYFHAIQTMYEVEKKSSNQVAAHFQMTQTGIRNNLKSIGVKMKPRGGRNNVKKRKE